MKIIRGILALALVASGLAGLQILLSDRWLWSVAPSHAYGLMRFVAFDLILVLAVLEKAGIGIVGAALVSGAQFGAMLADLVAGQPEGVPSIAFRAYLTSDTSYAVLLSIQIAILIVAVGNMMHPLGHGHLRWEELSRPTRPLRDHFLASPWLALRRIAY